MTDFSGFYPPVSTSGAPTYATFADFPSASSVGNGALAIALDTDTLYISTGTVWTIISGPGVALSVGTFDSGTPSSNGAHIDSNALIMQSASATNPGEVNTSTQTFAGVKTFNSNPNMAGLSASQAVVTDGSKNLASLAYTSANTATTLVERDGSGNFSATTITANLTGTASGNPPNSRSISTTAPLTGGGDLSADRTFAITQSTTSTNGYLSSTDWNTFNNKQASGNYITALTGDVTASGPGSVAATLAATSNATLTTLSGLTTAASLASVGTITSGTWSATTIALNKGGTGQTTKSAAFDALSPMTTLSDLIIGGASGTGTRLGIGSSGNVLTVSGGNPVWAAPATSGTVTSVAMTVPTFLSVAGSPVTSSGTLAVTLSGTALPVANGGTGLTSGTSGGILGYTGSGTLASSGALTVSQLIIGGGAGATPSTLAAGSQYQSLVMGATTPGYGQVNLAQSAAVTGTLAIGNGGTGVTSVTTSPTASSFSGWDANSNLSANATIDGYATTATGATTTTLTVASKYLQYFTGSTTQTVVLPVASTLVLGQRFEIVNLSSGVVTVQSSGLNTIQAMAANTRLIVTCILASGTGTASWSASYILLSSTGTVTSVAMTVPTFLSIAGSPVTTSGTLAVTLSGTALPVANGGTGLTSGTDGGILGYTATGTLASSALLTANQLIKGGGAGATPSTLAAGSQFQALVMGATTPGYGQIALNQSAAVTGTLAVGNGGLGIATGTSGGILGFTGSTTIASSGALTVSQLIIGGGAGATPSTLAAGSQFQVLVMGATTPGYGQVNLAQSAAITGTLPVANGGTATTTPGTTWTPTVANNTGTTGVPTVDSAKYHLINGIAIINCGFTYTMNTASTADFTFDLPAAITPTNNFASNVWGNGPASTVDDPLFISGLFFTKNGTKVIRVIVKYSAVSTAAQSIGGTMMFNISN